MATHHETRRRASRSSWPGRWRRISRCPMVVLDAEGNHRLLQRGRRGDARDTFEDAGELSERRVGRAFLPESADGTLIRDARAAGGRCAARAAAVHHLDLFVHGRRRHFAARSRSPPFPSWAASRSCTARSRSSGSGSFGGHVRQPVDSDPAREVPSRGAWNSPSDTIGRRALCSSWRASSRRTSRRRSTSPTRMTTSCTSTSRRSRSPAGPSPRPARSRCASWWRCWRHRAVDGQALRREEMPGGHRLHGTTPRARQSLHHRARRHRSGRSRPPRSRCSGPDEEFHGIMVIFWEQALGSPCGSRSGVAAARWPRRGRRRFARR